YTAAVLPWFVMVHVTSAIAPLVISGFVMSGLVMSGFVMSGLVMSGFVMSGLVMSGLATLRLVMSGLVMSGLVMSGLVMSGFVMSGFSTSALVISGLVMSGLVMSGFVISGFVISGLSAIAAASPFGTIPPPGPVISVTDTSTRPCGSLDVMYTVRAAIERPGTRTSAVRSGGGELAPNGGRRNCENDPRPPGGGL